MKWSLRGHKKEEDVRPDALVKLIKKEPEDKALRNIPVTPKNYGKFNPEPQKSHLPKGIAWGIAGLIVLFIGGSIMSYYYVRAQVANSLTEGANRLRAGVEDLQNFDPQSAAEEFSTLQSMQSSDLGVAIGALGFLFKGTTNAVSAIADLSQQLTIFSNELSGLESSAIGFLAQGRGDELLSQLNALRDTVAKIDDESNQISDLASAAPALSGAGGNSSLYISLKAQVAGARQFLDTFVPWLANPAPHHVLVFLDNPSEIRPGGGFLGSYADITIANGNITDIDVRDIADADMAFVQKIVPPKPLQLIVSRWRPADANWFFDFPTSASKTISFIEASKLYAGSTTFDGAVALTPTVISDLLAATGPIAVGKPTTTFTADNLVPQIQKIVQAGQATDATYPKQILRDLSTAIFAKLASTTDAERQNLLNAALTWVSDRDVMAYFKDPSLEKFFDAYAADGAMYDLPQKFNGDYLAVVDANVGGNKTDLYVSSTVDYTGVINADGTFTGHLKITRTHHGNRASDWWYKTPNQDYLQVFTPDATALTSASGGLQKKIVAPTNFAKNGYATDTLVTTIEGTEQQSFEFPFVTQHEESGRMVFATWSILKPGESVDIGFDYTHHLFMPPAPGVAYQFVFDKQAGTKRHYSFDVSAPLGYAFAENHLSTWSYEADEVPGRMIVNLTLEKLPE